MYQDPVRFYLDINCYLSCFLPRKVSERVGRNVSITDY